LPSFPSAFKINRTFQYPDVTAFDRPIAAGSRRVVAQQIPTGRRSLEDAPAAMAAAFD
jgi:hypothetical protein